MRWIKSIHWNLGLGVPLHFCQKAFFFNLIFLFLIGTASGFERNNSHILVKKVRVVLNRIKPFQTCFVQQVYIDEHMDIEESGEILFKDDQHLKWTYLKPDFKIFLMQKENYKFYDKENEQLTIGKIKERSQQWIWQLFFSEEILQYTHEQVNEAHKKIYITRRDSEPLNIEIRLNNDFLPVQVIQEDPNTGVRMIFYFKDYIEKIKIPKDTFEFKVPEDVEIIDGEIG